MMSDGVKFIVQASCFLVFFEGLWRHAIRDTHYWSNGLFLFLLAYVICIASEICGFKDSSLAKDSAFRSLLSISHGLDGLSAFVIGVAMYYRSVLWLSIGIAVMCKFGLIHLLNRMILAKKPQGDNFFDTMQQTTKSYLHHVASFLFVYTPEEIALTAAWRTISMTGHAMLVLRGKVSADNLRKLSWVLSYIRNAFMVALLATCFYAPSIRKAFGHSAAGHIAYMTVRLVPVFQLGGAYLTPEEKEEWGLLDDAGRMKVLLSCKHPWLTLELSLLVFTTVYFGFLRLHILADEVAGLVSSINGGHETLVAMKHLRR